MEHAIILDLTAPMAIILWVVLRHIYLVSSNIIKVVDYYELVSDYYEA